MINFVGWITLYHVRIEGEDRPWNCVLNGSDKVLSNTSYTAIQMVSHKAATARPEARMAWWYILL